MNVRPLTPDDVLWLRDRLAYHFAGPRIWSRGVWFEADALPGCVACGDRGEPLGAVVHTPMERGRSGGGEEPSGRATTDCEVIALFAEVEGRGVGSALLGEVEREAQAGGVTRLFLTTTNDNTRALRFYQRRGWRIAAWHHGSMDRARLVKPEIPLIGHDRIEVHDEIELEWVRRS